MPTHVGGPIDDLEQRLVDGGAEITGVHPSYSYPATNDVARECQYCGDPVTPMETHAIALVQYAPDCEERRAAAYPAFCGPTCLDQWVRQLDDER